MDRNSDGVVSGSGNYVALRKESVDRNTIRSSGQNTPNMSLSARRAWIEIIILGGLIFTLLVALRKESVDRNLMYH